MGTQAERAGILLMARLDSRRLPGKVLLDIAGRPLLALAAARLARSGLGGHIVLATSDRTVDDPIAIWASAFGLEVHRGPAEDVAQRCLDAARLAGWDWFLRISGDSPFIAPEAVDTVADLFRGEKPDLASNVFPRIHPPGLSAEAVSVDALARLLALSDDPQDREHVTKAFYDAPQRWRIASVPPSGETWPAGLHLAVDTQADLHFARALAERLADPVTASIQDIRRESKALLQQG